MMRGRLAGARRLAAVLALALMAWAGPATATEPDGDAPDDALPRHTAAVREAGSYEATLRLWRDAADINDWIGARFEYDRARALQLSETQRNAAGTRLAIHAPSDFFVQPNGVCVDLARFGVESLRVVDPDRRPRYLMIEFDPIEIAGNRLRRHWVALFEDGGRLYAFADSKRPGHLAGPYPDLRAYIDDYARYRGRTIVAYREMDSYERQRRTLATRQPRDDRR